MGAGIAEVIAAAGVAITLIDQDEAVLEGAVSRISANLNRAVDRGRMLQDEADVAISVIDTDTALDAASDSDLVIEAVPEQLELKVGIFRQLDEICGPTTILASNTSSISITELGRHTSRPERVIGMHFFNPVPVLPLVEVVRAIGTSEETVARAREFAEGIGKTPIVCEDRPGFIVNRLLIPYLNDAVHALSEGVASAEEIDNAMRLGANIPMGPLALADLVGLDVTLAAAETLYREFGDPKYRVAPLLRQLVRAGRLGRKTGEGFFTYGE